MDRPDQPGRHHDRAQQGGHSLDPQLPPVKPPVRVVHAGQLAEHPPAQEITEAEQAHLLSGAEPAQQLGVEGLPADRLDRMAGQPGAGPADRQFRPDGGSRGEGLPGQWRVVSGSWTDVAAGKQGSAGGDAFYLSDHTGSDFTYEGDVRLVDGTAAALTFRADPRAGRHYTANVDSKAGVVKVWRPGRDIATYKAPIKAGQTYHLKVVTQGQNIKVYLDDRAEPVIDTKDGEYASGHFGLNVFDGTAQFQNIRVS
ncbi:DUF1080 domain-containing protein [Nonomuraea diastatica]|uniref:DUF1080 domain-containing protein n=2 Tax=Nonomuraea diastatica TaxID=1848329 RepID=A0A4R4X0N8_9ACTN|nr:DUF1080 domain-containing protein [Nonomuraea diastatica]